MNKLKVGDRVRFKTADRNYPGAIIKEIRNEVYVTEDSNGIISYIGFECTDNLEII